MTRDELEKILNPTPFKAASNNMRFASNLLATSIAVPLTSETQASGNSTNTDNNHWDQNIHEIFQLHSMPFEIQPFINSIVLLLSSVNDDPYYQEYENNVSLQTMAQDGVTSVNTFFSFDTDFMSNLFIDHSSDCDALNDNHYIPTNDDDYGLAAFMPTTSDSDITTYDCGDIFS